MKKTAAVLAALLILQTPTLARAATGRLGTPQQQKAATKCQGVIGSVTSKVLLGKFKALDTCGNAALACVQTKSAKGDCLAKAGEACAKKLDAFGKVVEKAHAKIAQDKSCAKGLSFQDLLSADGLGLESLTEHCQSNFALNICSSFDPLAECLARTPDLAAGALYGEARPRMGELLGRLPVALPRIAGLAKVADCGAACPLTSPAAKAVEQCGKVVTKATLGLLKALNGPFSTCATSVFTCVQATGGDPGCSGKAATACDKGAAKIEKSFAAYAAAIAAKCGAEVVNADDLLASSGLNAEALGGSCTTEPSDAATLASCLQERTTCRAADFVRAVVARSEEFSTDRQLGDLGTTLRDACPALPSTLAVGARAFPFGGIVKFFKQVRRPKAGILGIRRIGGRPSSTFGAHGTITRIDGPSKIKFGDITKVRFTYRVGARTRTARAADDKPTLVVSVQRNDQTVSDFFDVELDALPTDGSAVEVKDDLELTYQDALPACSFTVSFAIRVGPKDVGEYASIPQVIAAEDEAGGNGVSNGPKGGQVAALAINPTSPTTLYVGTLLGGVFKSTNGGGSWSPIDVGFPSTPTVDALAVDPKHPDTVYAGGSGVYKTIDGGAGWEKASTGLPFGSIVALAVDPENTDTLYAGGSSTGVFKSSNGGTSWVPINNGLTSLQIKAVVIDPKNPNIVFAATNGGVFKTTDGGGGWTPMNNGITTSSINALVINANSPSTLYAGTATKGVFKTTNGGSTWSPSNVGLSASTQVLALAIAANDPKTLYVGTGLFGIFRSTNGGASWSPATTGVDAILIQALVVDPTSSATVYAGTFDGRDNLFKTTDRGVSWKPANAGFVATTVNAVVIDPAQPTNVYAGTLFEGSFRSTNGGASYQSTGALSATYTLAVAPGTPSTIYAGGLSTVEKSTDGGVTWNPVSTGLTGASVRDLVVDPHTSGTVYAGTSNKGVYKTINGGLGWTPVNGGLTSTAIEALVIDHAVSTTLYAGTTANGVFKTTNGGTSWNPANGGLTNTKILALAIDPSDASIIYAATNGGGVFKTTDNATSWVPMNVGLPTFIRSLAIDPSNPTTVYAGAAKLYQSTDAGGTWTTLPNVIPNDILGMVVDPSNPGRVYAATFGSGVVIVE